MGKIEETKHNNRGCIYYDSGKDRCERFNAKASKIADVRKCATGAMLCSKEKTKKK